MPYKHYFKDVSHLSVLDVYRVVELFEVPAGALDHAVKKILCAGDRGEKDLTKDISEARDSLNRWLDMRKEDEELMVMPVDLAKLTPTELQRLAKAAEYDEVIASAAGASRPSAASDDERFDEPRVDIIGQNGNDGEHYAAIEQEESRTFKAMADKLEVPPQVPRQSDKPKPKPVTVVLPDTSGMVDPTGRPRWSDVPGWVQWMAQDKKGVWKGFQCKPEARSGKWASTKRYIELNSGEPMIGENWTLMIEERP